MVEYDGQKKIGQGREAAANTWIDHPDVLKKVDKLFETLL